MAFEWLVDFHVNTVKSPDYAEKTLAQYRLGMKALGSIVGVTIRVDEEGCEPSRALDAGLVHHPDDAPRLPLPGCTKGDRCRCVYRPVMKYQVDASK